MVHRDITLEYLLQAARRRKLAIALPAAVITIAAVIFAMMIPNIYRTDTVILVEPQQSVETQGGKPSITVEVERERLNTLSQQILSRSHLEPIIAEFNLYAGMAMEQRIENMRDNIKLEIVHPSDGANVSGFKITYEHRDPRVCTDVANRVASLFIEQNTTSRERFLGDRAKFLEEQLAQAKAKLDEQEQKIQEFKQRNLGVLPEQRDSNFKLLEQLNQQLMANNDAINRAEQQRVYIETMLTQYKMAPKTVKQRLGETAVTKAPTLVEKQLEDLKAHLADLRSKYTEQHPDVIRTIGQVAELERKHAAEMASAHTGVQSAPADNKEKEFVPDQDTAPEMFANVAQLNSQLRSIKSELTARNETANKLQRQMHAYQAKLELSPALEQELSALTRDYNVAKENYTALSNEKLSSEMAQELESKQKTMLFRVLDPAKTPEKPYKPNRRSIALFGMLAGIGCGLGFAFYREFADESLRNEKELETALGLDVLAVIPRISKTN